MISQRRFMVTPFWRLTRWGILPDYWRIRRGGDEDGRLSWFIIIPLIGEFVWFDAS